MSDTYGVTRSTDLHGLSLERIAFLAGAMNPANQLPFARARLSKVLQTQFFPIEAPGPHRRKTSQGTTPNPRRLKPGQAVTYNHVVLENSHALSRQLQIGIDAAISELELMGALGDAAAWAVLLECLDFIMNDAFTVAWADGVPFYSDSHPSETGVQSNILASAFDAAALKSALIMLRKMRGHDGQFVGQQGAYVMSGSDLAPTIWELVQPGTRSPTPGATAITGPSYIGQQGLSVVESQGIDDTDAWGVFGRNFVLEIVVADPSAPKIEPVVGTRDKIASDEMTLIIGTRNWRGAIGCGPA